MTYDNWKATNPADEELGSAKQGRRQMTIEDRLSTPARNLVRDLKNLWEGCIPFEEALLMIGVTDEFEAEEFERIWDRWDASNP